MKPLHLGIYYQHDKDDNIVFVIANVFTYICVNIIGIFFHYPMEAQQREAFLETRNCISVRLATQKENQKQ
ncbi:adenylate cyclase, partial [Biomphalaria glabrata]